MLAFTVTITRRYICSASSYCDNNDNNVGVYRQRKTIIVTWGGICVVLIVTVIITGRYICSVIRYCDNNGDVCMQC